MNENDKKIHHIILDDHKMRLIEIADTMKILKEHVGTSLMNTRIEGKPLCKRRVVLILMQYKAPC